MFFWLVGSIVPMDCTMQHEDLGVIFVKKKNIAFRLVIHFLQILNYNICLMLI